MLADSPESNFLEALHLFLSPGEVELLREHSRSSGVKICIFSSGNCQYWAE